MLDDERVRAFFRATVLARLERVDVSRVAGQLLDVLTADRRHQRLLDGVLRQLARMLDDDDDQGRSRRGRRRRGEVPALRRARQRRRRYATEKMLAGVGRGSSARWATTRSIRCGVRFDEFVAASSSG